MKLSILLVLFCTLLASQAYAIPLCNLQVRERPWKRMLLTHPASDQSNDLPNAYPPHFAGNPVPKGQSLQRRCAEDI